VTLRARPAAPVPTQEAIEGPEVEVGSERHLGHEDEALLEGEADVATPAAVLLEVVLLLMLPVYG